MARYLFQPVCFNGLLTGTKVVRSESLSQVRVNSPRWSILSTVAEITVSNPQREASIGWLRVPARHLARAVLHPKAVVFALGAVGASLREDCEKADA